MKKIIYSTVFFTAVLLNYSCTKESETTEETVITNPTTVNPNDGFAVINFQVTPLEVKETLVKPFELSRTNLSEKNTYQMKFTSDKPCIIYDALDNIVPQGTFFSIPSKDGAFIYKYLANQSANPNLTVNIKNQLNTDIEKTLPIKVNAAPILKSIKAEQDETNGIADLYFTFIDFALGTGEEVAEYEFKAFKSDGTLIGVYNSNYTRIPAQNRGPWSYKARIKDKSGRWSPEISGQFIDYP
jgi:hypothetical protein